MPIVTTYPGVYIEELPSGQHTITGVATSITAFVGRAPIGPVDDALTIFSFGDFERFYGGLSYDYPMSYAVRDFFLNGGSQAVIARVFQASDGKGSGAATLRFPSSPLPLAEGWQVSGKVTKTDVTSASGVTTLTLVGGQYEAEAGDTFTISGDTTTYTVSSFTTSNNTTTVDFSPKLAVAPCPCAVLSFERGPDPSGWQVKTAAQASDDSVTIEKGTGVPKIGDTLTVPNNTQSYVVLGYTPASGNTDASISIAPAISTDDASSFAAGTSLSFSDMPAPPPIPMGWKVLTAVTGGSSATAVVITGGFGDPQPGDTFQVGDDTTNTYTVLTYDDTTNTITLLAATQQDFAACADLTFKRLVPSGWKVATAPSTNDLNKLVIEDADSNTPGSGTIEPGMLFTVGSATVQPYEVRYYDASSKTIYFLPDAKVNDFNGNPVLNFLPQLTLVAADPGVWGNSLTATVEIPASLSDSQSSGATADQYGLTSEDFFNLTVQYTNPKGKTTSEKFLNVSVKNTHSPSRLDRILKEDSQFVRVQTDLTDSEHEVFPPGDGVQATGKGGYKSDALDAATFIGDEHDKTGIYLLDKTSLFNILCIPPDQRQVDLYSSAGDQYPEVYTAAVAYCTDRRAMLIVDPPKSWAVKAMTGRTSEISPADSELGISGVDAQNAAIYFPRVIEQDIEMKSQTYVFPACGIIAGLWAATDVRRGVWKAPAGQNVGLLGITGLEVNLSDNQNGQLNPLGINCLRNFPVVGPVVWGARTLRGADQLESDYKYINVRRLTDYIEDSLYQGTKWAVFEPNNEALWSALRLSVGGFMAQLSREGAFYDYKVVCDATTTTQQDIDQGIVNVLVQFAPVKPAEFVVIQIQQQAGKSTS